MAISFNGQNHGGRNHNMALVRGGFAETLTIPPNNRYERRFERAERRARREGAGRWGRCYPSRQRAWRARPGMSSTATIAARITPRPASESADRGSSASSQPKKPAKAGSLARMAPCERAERAAGRRSG